MAESKLLNFHEDKSGMLIFGSKKFQKKIKEQLDKKPVTLCNKPMNLFESERYLGEILGSSLSQSVFLTIQKRKSIVQRLISEIRVTVEDCRSNSVGGLLVGFEIWSKAVIPFLFNNAGCWFEMPKKALNLLNSLTHSFYRSIFRSPKGTPLVSYYWDSGHLLNENYIIQEKVLFSHHLALLPDSALAKEIYLKQKNEGIKGPVSEYDKLLELLNIRGDPSMYSRKHFRSLVKSRVHEKNKADLLIQMRTYKKLEVDKLSSESYGQKSYLSSMKISEARTFFSARSMMLSTVKYNFKGNPVYAANEYKCECGDLDTQANLVTCRLYEHLREGLDLLN